MSIKIGVTSFLLIIVLGGTCFPQEQNVDWFVKFDEYSYLSIAKEKERLDKFVAQLRSQPEWLGYVEVYAGRCTYIREANIRANRVKRYLLERGIAAQRIVNIDGGYRENFTVDLWMSPRGAPNLPLSPTLKPNEVRIIQRPKKRAACLRNQKLLRG